LAKAVEGAAIAMASAIIAMMRIFLSSESA
jgi:hypothetical protein